MEEDTDRFDAISRSDTIRVFGLSVLQDESSDNIREHVVRNVLQVACPTAAWECDDLKRTYRVGGWNGDQTPVIFIQFRYDDDITQIYMQVVINYVSAEFAFQMT